MEDKEFEELRFKFERYKHLDNERIQGYNTSDRQFFVFNIGVITLIFFAVYQSLEYNIPKIVYILPLIAVYLCGVSCALLMKTYSITHSIIDIQQGLIFNYNDDKDKECDKLKEKNNNNAKWAFRFLYASFIMALITIFLAVFLVDFTKEKEVSKIEVIKTICQ
jgi:hypothetical protein